MRSGIRKSWLHFLTKVMCLCLLLSSASLAQNPQKSSNSTESRKTTGKISAEEFSRIVHTFSEEDGYFFSDNFISNETAYPFIFGKFDELGMKGGAYIGVGPEQNFSYIAHIRPQIAFIVDIRKQAVIQHLMYKAIFQYAKNRMEFLSWLFCKPVTDNKVPGENATLADILDYFVDAATTREAFEQNLITIRKTIEKEYRFPMTPEDIKSLEYVYQAFWMANLRITFQMGFAGFPTSRWGRFPTLYSLLLAKDASGRERSFLATEEDYRFLRKLQLENRIIPINGDFGGKKALATVGGYLQEKGYTVTAFYTSNVEQYLYADGIFNNFVDNIRKLPISPNSMFLRMARTGWEPHPAYIPGHRMTPLLQRMNIFLKDYDANRFPDYWSLITTDFIGPNIPTEPAQ